MAAAAPPPAASASPDPVKTVPPAKPEAAPKGGNAPVPAAASAPPPAPPAPLQGSASDDRAVLHTDLRVVDWVVEGTAKAVGNAEVGYARIDGVGTVGGALKAGAVLVRGTLHVELAAEVAEHLEVRGGLRVGAGLRAGRLTVDGQVETGQDLVVRGPADLTGKVEVGGALRAERLDLHGPVRVLGELRAPTVIGEFSGVSETGPIHADFLDLKPARPLFPWEHRGTLRTLRIEANEVHLEGVTVEFLRAERIYLGEGCRVARHEGTILARHRSAVVGPSAVSHPWAGLTR